MSIVKIRSGVNNVAIRAIVLATLGIGLSACGSSSKNDPSPQGSENDTNEGGTNTSTEGTTTEGTDSSGAPVDVQTTTLPATVATDNNGNCPSVQASGSNTSAIAGLWEGTEIDSFGTDIYYFLITSDGQIIDYDYQQDDFGSGANCYTIDSDTAIRATGGNGYRSSYYDIGFPSDQCVLEEQQVTVVVSGDTLTVTSIDEFDDDMDGDTTDTVAESYQRLSGVSANDLQPCN